MNPWRWVDPRVASVRLAGVRAYLLGRGWVVKAGPNPNFLRFEKPPQKNAEPVFQMVPASDRFGDFAQAMACLITTLSELEDCHPVAVLDDILQGQQGAAGDAGTRGDKTRQRGAG